MSTEDTSRRNDSSESRSTGNRSSASGGYQSRDDRGGSGDRGDSRSSYRRSRPFFRKKVCRFCTQGLVADYKNPDSLRRFVTDRGKILPRRITGNCAKHQRTLAMHVKRSRALALLPFVKN